MKTSSLRQLACLTGALLALTASGVSNATGSRPAGAADLAAASSPRFTPGREYRYDLDVTHRARLATETAAPEKSLLDYRVRGQWSVTFVGHEGDGGRYRVALSDVAIEVGGKDDGESELRSDLARPFWFDTDREGKITGLYFERAAGAESRGFLREAAASLQVVLKPEPQWTSAEQDPTGEYESRYVRDGATGEVRKSRARYLRMVTSGGLRPVAEVGRIDTNDDVRIRMTEDGFLQSLSAHATTDIQLRTGAGHIRTAAEVSAVLRGTSLQATFVGELERHAASVVRVDMAALLTPAATEETKRIAASNLLANASITELVHAAALAPTATPQERGAAVARLSAAFLVRPSDARTAVTVARTSSPAIGAAIVAGLGGTHTAEAQVALVDLAASSGVAQSVRMNALAALALHEMPTRETVSSLGRLQRSSDPEVRSGAMLAAGNVARTMRRSDAETSRAIVATLLRQLGAATSDHDRVTLLRALGNAGDPGVLPLTRAATLPRNAAMVRVAAAASVRFVAGREVDDLLAQLLVTDPDPRVVREVIGTVEGFRKVEDFVAVLGTLSRTSPSPAVRRAAVRAVARLRDRTDVEALLEDVSVHDESEDVRASAAAALTSLRTSEP